MQHGLAMWSVFGLSGIVQLASARYMKGTYWKYYKLTHILNGFYMVLMAIVSGYDALDHANWEITWNYHGYLGVPAFIGIGALSMGGTASNLLLGNLKRQTKSALALKWIHGTCSTLLLIQGTFAIATGIYYYRIHPKHQYDFPYEVLHLATQIGIVAYLEIRYRNSLKEEEPFDNKKAAPISLEEFNKRVKAGEKLVILDDMVIDVSDYMDHHPGGRFSLENNIGKDISKFFYGGYSQESNLSPHTHSNEARKALNTLIVATLVQEVSTEIFKISESQSLTSSITSVTFSRAAKNPQPLPNPVLNLEHAGKHFLVRQAGKRTYRQFTYCFAIQPEVYKHLTRLAADGKKAIDGVNDSLKQRLSWDEINLTIKNYSENDGLSKAVHMDLKKQAANYEIKGLLGTGL